MMHLTNYSVNKQSVAYNPTSLHSFFAFFRRFRNPAFVQNLDGQGEEDPGPEDGVEVKHPSFSSCFTVSWRSWQDKEDAAVDESGQPRASKWLGPLMTLMFFGMFCWHCRSVKTSFLYCK